MSTARTGFRRTGALLLAAWLCGCAAEPPVLDPLLAGTAWPRDLELTEVPSYVQAQDQCGPAALASLLNASGVDVLPETLAAAVFLPARRGSLQPELVAAVRRHERMPYLIDADPGALLRQLQAGHPVLVLQNLGLRSRPVWHYAVVVGYDAADDRILLRSGAKARRDMSAPDFLRSWEDAGRWGLLALVPGELPAEPDADRVVAAAADLEATGHPAAAVAAYRAAVRRWPTHTLARLGLGNGLYGLGDLVGAEQAFRALLNDEPDHPVARNNLAWVLAENGRFQDARMQIEQALERTDVDAGMRDLFRQTAREIDRRAAALSPDADRFRAAGADACVNRPASPRI